MAHWFLHVTLGFGVNMILIATGGFDPITNWQHLQIYRSHAACERAAKQWHDAYDADPMYTIHCVRYGRRRIDI
jgi:hypothetical protein